MASMFNKNLHSEKGLHVSDSISFLPTQFFGVIFIPYLSVVLESECGFGDLKM